MGGIGLAYRTGSGVSPSGGGAPPGAATVWPAVADWAALSTVGIPRRLGDQVAVSSIGPGNAFGIAAWDGSAWVLFYAMFDSLADLEAFADPIATYAIAGVEASGSDDETAVRYVYDGAAWARSAVNQPYVWETTNPLDVSNPDPSGIGCTRDGDLLVVTNGSEVMVYDRRTYTVAGGDAADVSLWVAVDVPPSWKLKSYATGSDAVGSGSWSSSGSGTGSVTASGGYHVLNGGTGSANLASGFTPSTTQGVYMFAEARADTAAAVGRGWQIGDGTNASRMYQIGSGAVRLYDTSGSVVAAGAATNTTVGALPDLSSDPARMDITDLSPTTWTVTRQNGVRLQQFRRNLITVSPFTAVRMVALAGTILHVRNYGVIGP